MTSLKLHNRFTPQNSCMLLGIFSTKGAKKRIVKFEILNFWQFFFFFLFFFGRNVSHGSRWGIIECVIF